MPDNKRESDPKPFAAPSAPAPEPVLDLADETDAEREGRKANPLLERVLDEIQVAIDNLSGYITDGKLDKLKDAHQAVLDVAKSNRPSKRDRDEQAKAEAAAKKPQ